MNTMWHWPSFFFYISIILLTCIFSFIAQKVTLSFSPIEKANSKKIYNINFLFLIISFCIAWIVSGARSYVGMDYVSYYNMHFTVEDNISKVWNIRSLKDLLLVERPGFYLIVYLTKLFFKDPQYIFVVTSFFTLLFVYKGILYEKKHINITIAIFLYMTLYYIPSFTIVAQYLSGAIVFWGYRYVIEKKLFKYLICILIATSIHYAAIIALPVYFYCHSNKNKFLRLIYILAIIIFFFSYDYLFSALVEGSRYTSYLNESITTGTGLGQLFNRLPLLVLIIFFKDKLIQSNPNNIVYIDIFILELILSQLAYITPIINRGIAFLSIAQILLIPSFVKVASKDIKPKPLIFLTSFIIIIWGSYNFINMISNTWWIRDSSFPYQTFSGWKP